MLWLALPFLAIAALANRVRLGRSVERAYAGRFPGGEAGVARGAEGFSLNGTSGNAVLLLHGSGDTPQSMRYLAEKLNVWGYTVFAPLLPGHGRSPRAFADVTADGYHTEATRALDSLRKMHEWVAVVGQSMGGAIAARLAAERGDVRAVVLLAPYLVPPREVRAAAVAGPLWSAFSPYIVGGGEASVHDKTASGHNMAYGSYTPAALRALVETARRGASALRDLRLPTLVVNSTQDNRIPRALAEQALAGAGPGVEKVWVTGCGHIITIDYCKDEVARLVIAFLDRHTG